MSDSLGEAIATPELVRVKLNAEIYEAMYDEMHAELNAYIEKSETQLANICNAIDWLWGFYNGNSLRAILGFEDDIQEAWVKLLMSTEEI